MVLMCVFDAALSRVPEMAMERTTTSTCAQGKDGVCHSSLEGLVATVSECGDDGEWCGKPRTSFASSFEGIDRPESPKTQGFGFSSRECLCVCVCRISRGSQRSRFPTRTSVRRSRDGPKPIHSVSRTSLFKIGRLRGNHEEEDADGDADSGAADGDVLAGDEAEDDPGPVPPNVQCRDVHFVVMLRTPVYGFSGPIWTMDRSKALRERARPAALQKTLHDTYPDESLFVHPSATPQFSNVDSSLGEPLSSDAVQGSGRPTATSKMLEPIEEDTAMSPTVADSGLNSVGDSSRTSYDMGKTARLSRRKKKTRSLSRRNATRVHPFQKRVPRDAALK